MIVLALVALAVAVGLAAGAFLVLWLDRFTGETVVWLALLVSWGAACALALHVAAPSLGALDDLKVVFGRPALVAAAARVLEELLLAVGLAALATSHYLDGPLDGAVYGTVTGLGFSVFQVVAALHAGTPYPSPSMPVLVTLGQAGATALVGGAFGFVKLAVRAALRVPIVLAAVLVGGMYQWGVVGAAAWAWQAWGSRGTGMTLVLAAVAALIGAGILAACLTFERRVLARQLAEEVELGVLPAWVVEVIPRYRRRVRPDWWPRRDERREIVRLLTSLAYRKHQLRGLPEDRANLYGLEVGRLRQRTRLLLALTDRPSDPVEF